MEQSIVAYNYCNKNFWYVFLVSVVLTYMVLCSRYSSSFAGSNSAAIFFATYENHVFSQAYSYHDFKKEFGETSTTVFITKENENPVGDEEENSELVSKDGSEESKDKMNKTDNLDSCLGRYVYVHDLPSRFNDDIVKNCSSLDIWFNMCESLMNDGLGPQALNTDNVLQNNSWFATNQFTLEIIFYNRMKQYKCLTKDSSLASAVYVPFYAGLDVGRYLWDGSNTSVRDSESVDLFEWLSEKPEWKKMWGGDHFFVGGRITWDFRRMSDNDSDWGNKLLRLPEAKNMTMLTIESSPWSNIDFGIPYPSYFHPSRDNEVLEWQNKMRGHKRPYLFSFVGAPRPKQEKSVRGEIIRQCLASNGSCKLLDCNTENNNCHDPSHVMKLFQSSTFCLQPQGDSYTRRSTFDSILAGCIPVFFHPGSAYIQYMWHLPQNYTQYSVFIRELAVQDGKASIEKILKDISRDKVSALREEAIRLIPIVVYADPRSRLYTLEDAFDVAVKGVLDRVETIRREMKHGRNFSSDFPAEFTWKYQWGSYFTRT